MGYGWQQPKLCTHIDNCDSLRYARVEIWMLLTRLEVVSEFAYIHSRTDTRSSTKNHGIAFPSLLFSCMVLINEKQLCIIKGRFYLRFFREINLPAAHERMLSWRNRSVYFSDDIRLIDWKALLWISSNYGDIAKKWSKCFHHRKGFKGTCFQPCSD